VPGGFGFGRVFLAFVAHRFDIGMPEKGVVVEVELGVERDHVAAARHHERIDLDNRGIEFRKCAIGGQDEARGRRHLLAGQAQPECQAPGMERLDTTGRIDRHFQDLLGVCAATSSISMPPSWMP
jgi:hypothetical protein